jgi:signal transduction histidine kinase
MSATREHSDPVAPTAADAAVGAPSSAAGRPPIDGADAERNTAWLAYVSAVSILGAAIAPLLLASPDLRAALGSAGFWLFAAFVLVGELFPLRVQMRDELIENTTSVTFSFALVLAYGAGPAVLPDIIASAVGDIYQRKSLLRVAFNVGQYTISIAASGFVYRALNGHSHIAASDIPAMAAAGAAMFLVNTIVTSIAVGLWRKSPLLPYVYRNVVFSLHMTPALIALSPIVVLVAHVSLWFVPLFAIPIGAVYWGMTKALENSRLVERLRGSLEQMTELNRMKDDFVAVVSHELRTPLTSVQGYVKTLLQLQGQLDHEQELSFLEAADRQSERLGRLIEQLLVVGRLETHAEPLVAARTSIPSVASNVVEELRPRANGHVFDFLFGADVPFVTTDEGKVHQILSNLVENALKYSPPGSRITLRVEQGVNGVLAAVQDEGHGIPEDQREQVFERFYQVDSSATRSVGGTGLGLYICRRMADQLGARIWLEASGERGSTFCLFIPTSPPAATEANGSSPGLDAGVPAGAGPQAVSR